MKQTILALGAAAALGFAGAAHAVAYFGPGSAHPKLPQKFDITKADPMAKTNVVDAVRLNQAAGGVGHMLFMPYYNAQEGTETMFQIANTDSKNGKAVKVRLRGASNSDDVLDFTLLLSPNDMWSAKITYPKGGIPRLVTPDASCTLPKDLNSLSTLKYARLNGIPDEVVSPTNKQVLVSEGYMEVLAMADLPDVATKDVSTGTAHTSSLYSSILHTNGKPGNCNSDAVRQLFDTTVVDDAKAADAGLYPNTGGLMGSWVILNQDQVATYSGNMTAIRAESDDGMNGIANIIFSPQNNGNIDIASIADAGWGDPFKNNVAAKGHVGILSADPLLRAKDSKGKFLLPPKWFDLPDMSTPLLKGTEDKYNPQIQVMSLGLLHNDIKNEWLNDPEGAITGVPMTTDWVVSQPTRRYYAAVDYAGKQLVWNTQMGSQITAAPGASGGSWADAATSAGETLAGAASNNVYAGLEYRVEPFKGMGPFACMTGFKFVVYDREEGSVVSVADAAVSPEVEVPALATCGEVFVLSFAPKERKSVMNAEVARVAMDATSYPVDMDGKPAVEGWAQIDFQTRLPIVGFAATQFRNDITRQNFGGTWGHRWD